MERDGQGARSGTSRAPAAAVEAWCTSIPARAALADRASGRDVPRSGGGREPEEQVRATRRRRRPVRRKSPGRHADSGLGVNGDDDGALLQPE